MPKINTTHDVFVTKLQALYDIEKVLEKALPKLWKASKNHELKEGFKKHLEETKNHSKRIEEAFNLIGIKPKKLKAEGIRGIGLDADWVIGQKTTPEIKDSLLAGSARYAEHYEMAGYMTAIEISMFMGLEAVTNLLMENLEEEKGADQKLTEFMRDNMKVS